MQALAKRPTREYIVPEPLPHAKGSRWSLKEFVRIDNVHVQGLIVKEIVNGANEANCNFAIFSSPENTAAWEQGKKDAALFIKQEEG